MRNYDIYRLLVAIGVAYIVGWAVGHVWFCLSIGLALYGVWQLRQLNELLIWIQDRKRNRAPDMPGVFEDICREIDFLRERHKRRKKKLGSYLKQFHQATRALPDSTVVIDEYGAVTWANAAAADFLGIHWPEDAGQRITNLIRRPELADFVNGDDTSSSIDIPSPVDANVILNIRLTPSGNRQRLFVARDITQLHRANQVRSDFVANVSHELRTPITVLRGNLENMNRQRDQAPAHWHEPLEQMGAHVVRMQAVVEDLLTLSKLEQSAELDNPQIVAVAAIISDIQRQSSNGDEPSDRLFALEVDTELMVYGVEKELFSCFSNLIYNAVRYTEEREVIEISWYRDDAGAHFSVKDHGIGIAQEHIPRLTERFYRIDSGRARAQGGTGLGLAIVKHVLSRHNATLHIESELGVGSLFRCDFPPSAIVVPTQMGEDVEVDKSA